jgi:hypothetical protein
MSLTVSENTDDTTIQIVVTADTDPIESTTGFVHCSAGSIHLNTIILSLPESLSSLSSLLACSGGSIFATECTITTNPAGITLTYLLVSVTGSASVRMTELYLINVFFNVPSLIVLAAESSLRMDSCNFSWSPPLSTGSCVVSGADARVIDLSKSLFMGISRGGMDGGCVDLSYAMGSGRNVSIVEYIFDSCGVTGIAGEGGGGIFTSMELGVRWTIRNSTMRTCTAPSVNEGRGGGIFLSLTQSLADFRIVTTCFTNNKAHLGNDVFVISPNLTATVTRSRFPFFDPEQSFDEELMQGWEGTAHMVEEEQSLLLDST